MLFTFTFLQGLVSLKFMTMMKNLRPSGKLKVMKFIKGRRCFNFCVLVYYYSSSRAGSPVSVSLCLTLI
jgi:hypothetical protein